MKQRLKQLIKEAFQNAYESGELPSDQIPEIEIEQPKADVHGDFATNAAMTSAAIQRMAPRKIAEALKGHLKDSEDLIQRLDIAGPGFINFFIQPKAWLPVLEAIHAQGLEYGRSQFGRGQRVQVEFVSANPTGPLHVGHGRGAAVGDSVARILAFCGYDVQREYYINDSGRQIRTLGRSVFLRYRELLGQTIEFPEDCYQGDYIRELAAEIKDREGTGLLDKDPEEAIGHCARYAAGSILAGIREDLKDFGVDHDCWFSEQSLYDEGRVSGTMETMRQKGLVYEKDGALWFNTSQYGDEKDRVVVRSGSGETTYFASDIAYHQNKYERGFDWVIDVWGADHHGYIPRMRAAIEASGYKREQFDVILIQLVNLLRAGEPVAMSTRAGEFETLKDVISEVGRDAARFIFLTRHYESPLDFDLELAKRKTNDNPVYYVQYVHARIASILRKAEETGSDTGVPDDAELSALTAPEELTLLKLMLRYPEVVENSGRFLEPHRIAFFLTALSGAFHSYYNRHKVLSDDPGLTRARLHLVTAVKWVIANGLNLLGVLAPEQM